MKGENGLEKELLYKIKSYLKNYIADSAYNYIETEEPEDEKFDILPLIHLDASIDSLVETDQNNIISSNYNEVDILNIIPLGLKVTGSS